MDFDVLENVGSEIKLVDFCETFEGEFPFIGSFITMLRFAHCNLQCSWCDTDFSKAKVSVKLDQILESVTRTRNLMITGGEPGLHSSKIYTIISEILSTFTYVDKITVQTNGLIFKSSLDKRLTKEFDFRDFYYVWSPKFIDVKTTKQSFLYLVTLKEYVSLRHVYIKLVYDPLTKGFLSQFIDKVKELYGYEMLSRTAIMPLTSQEDKFGNYKETIEFCREKNVNFSPRIHMLYDVK